MAEWGVDKYLVLGTLPLPRPPATLTGVPRHLLLVILSLRIADFGPLGSVLLVVVWPN